MIKKYVLYQLKQWIPYIIFLFVLMASICWITSLNNTMETTIFSKDGGLTWQSYTSIIGLFNHSQLLEFGIVGLVCSCLMPFLIYQYRFSTKSADTFLQLPFKEKQFRRIRLILGLTIFLILFTLVMWVSVVILAINASRVTINSFETISGVIYQTIPVELNYLYYLPAYLVFLTLISIEYLSCSYIISKCNNLLDAIIQVSLYQIALLMIFYIPMHFFTPRSKTVISIGVDELSLSMAVPICFIFNYFGSLITQSSSGFVSGREEIIMIVSFVLYCILHIVMAVFTLWEKEPSGEYSGKPGSQNVLMKILPHVTFALIGMWMFTFMVSSIDISMVLVYVIFMLAYYVILAILKRNVRLNKASWITFVSISLTLCIGNCVFLLW